MKRLKYIFLLTIITFVSVSAINEGNDPDKTLVYVFDIKDEIAKPVFRTTENAMGEAMNMKADVIIIHMNTYGGLVNVADSIRTKILNSKIPVYVFVDNNAASAGALISIAADSIYMRPGGNIGAATVVNQTGAAMPDKYQSYMRSTMRSTAEAHGKDTTIVGNDTIIKWHRDPLIAEAMVDPRTYIEGIIDTGKVLTFTTEEAIKYGYCEGAANTIEEVIDLAGIKNYEIKRYTPSALDKFILLLLKPAIQGILILLIIGGLYFELQSPGIGFPLAAAITAAVFYFMPLYLEGLAENWEIIIVIIGIGLIAVEIFAIPGFGIAGISGIVLFVLGLTLSMVDNFMFEVDAVGAFNMVTKAFLIVVIAAIVAIVGSIIVSKQLFTSSPFSFLALQTTQETDKGFVGIDPKQKTIIGKEGTAITVLRPAGKVSVDDEIYDAIAEVGFIDKGSKVKVTRDEAGQIFVLKV